MKYLLHFFYLLGIAGIFTFSLFEKEKSPVTFSNSYYINGDGARKALSLTAKNNETYRAKEFGKGPGPSTPEVQKFTPYNVTELVDPFTGDFNYSIPLMDIEGYPLTLTYNSGVKPEDEASNVGLGWNLNIGQVIRNMRGLPDDSNGDEVYRSMNIKERVTTGGSLKASVEIFGFDPQFAIDIGASATVKANSYTGFGLDYGYNLGLAVHQTDKTQTSDTSTFKAAINFGRQFSTSGPPSFTANGGIDISTKNNFNKTSFGGNVGTSVNSIEGMKGFNFSTSLNATRPNGSSRANNFTVGNNFDLSFAKPVAIPPSQFPMISAAFSSRIGVSGEVSGFAPGASLEVFEQREWLATNEETIPAYGYLYEDKNQGALERCLLDFNREKDGPYIKQSPVLPIPFSSYDVFSVSGQGIAGQFRPFRNDIGTVHDPILADGSFSVNIGAQIKAGNIAGVGLDVTGGASGSIITKWELFNNLATAFSFLPAESGDIRDHVYFRNMGEFTVLANDEKFNKLGGFRPVRANISLQSIPDATLITGQGTSLPVNNDDQKRDIREPRNINFSYLTAQEASVYGKDDSITIYDINDTLKTGEKRINSYRKKDHISEINILRNDGVNYCYGIPAYNTFYKEVTFNSGSSQASGDGHFVPYSPGDDNTLGNQKGTRYFTSTEMPAYAYAYLLTSIVSPDYIDMAKDGPTTDDLGTYTKFNYSRKSTNFKWRNPYKTDTAYYSPGSYSDNDDNSANYVYGEKELWYINSIESRNFIAKFTLQDRDDGLITADENGGIVISGGASNNKNRLSRINSIKLYIKSDLIKNRDKARPVKTIDFEYDYSLCYGAPGSKPNRGKLTLKRLVISYSNSDKEKLSPYRFQYYDENKAYKDGCTDRWGTYKENHPGDLSSIDFPYTKQIPETDSAVRAWNLSAIILPTGGKIKVEYESDDYAYVQNKRAMEMIQVAGFSTDPLVETTPSQNLYNNLNLTAISNGDAANIVNSIKPYIVFKLKTPLRHNQQDSLYQYLKDVKQLYFNFRINLLTSDNPSTYEKIDGFINLGEINNSDFENLYGFYGTTSNEKYSYAYVKIRQRRQSDLLTVHPITWLAWQKAKSMLPVVYGNGLPVNDLNPGTFTEWLMAKIGQGPESLVSLFFGFYDKMFIEGRGSKVDITKSFIRLNSPEYRKLGGGLRVKKILINDNWGKMQSAPNPLLDFTYGQKFEYIKRQNGATISSGVASYEPVIGGEENAFTEQDPYCVERYFAPNEILNTLKPYGESFFQSAVVGYSRVKISNIHRGEKLKKNGPGFSVHEFYTARDFPTKTSHTTKAREEFYLPPNPLVDIITHTASQGFYVETNNMHGKLKSFSLFPETDTLNPIKSTKYFYKTNPSVANELDNEVRVAYKGAVFTRLVGIDYDMIADARHVVNAGGTLDMQVNVDYFQAGPVPIVVPVPIPWPSFSLHELKTHVITKFVQRSGILDSVQEINNGTISTTENILFDGITGEVLVTRQNDEFGDDYYTTSIPAYWEQKNMGPAFENVDYHVDNVQVTVGLFSLESAGRFFSVGDKLILDDENEPKSGWVRSIGSTDAFVIDESGSPIQSGNYDIKIISSGKRNMTSAKAGTLITKSNPVVTIGGESMFDFTNVIDASAVKYNERWQTYQGIKINYPAYKCRCLPDIANKIILTTLLDSLSKIRNLCNDPSFNLKTGSCTANVLFDDGGILIRLQGPSCFKKGCEVYLKDPLHYIGDSICELKFANLELAIPTGCAANNSFNLLATYTSPHGETTVYHFEGTISCLKLNNCEYVEDGVASVECNITDGTIINPFLAGTMNNWRPVCNYKYVTTRNYEDPSINKKGFYNDFTPFWAINEFGIRSSATANKAKWTRVDSATIIDPFGHLLESQDVLKNYSSSIFGYGFTLPIATVQNSRQSDVAADNFEDYFFTNKLGREGSSSCQLPPHWKFSNAQHITNEESHTGKYSMQVTTDSIISLKMPELLCATEPSGFNNCDLIRNFSPQVNNYVASAWVMVKQCIPLNPTPPTSGPSPALGICQYPVPGESGAIMMSISRREQDLQLNTLCTLQPTGKMIEGWQLFTGEFEITDYNYKTIEFKIIKTETGPVPSNRRKVFIDDVRIHPRNANMETFVYDSESLRLQAKMDLDNFATLYEYDMEGNLVRIKKETEKGIKTIREVRSGKPKLPYLSIE